LNFRRVSKKLTYPSSLDKARIWQNFEVCTKKKKIPKSKNKGDPHNIFCIKTKGYNQNRIFHTLANERARGTTSSPLCWVATAPTSKNPWNHPSQLGLFRTVTTTKNPKRLEKLKIENYGIGWSEWWILTDIERNWARVKLWGWRRIEIFEKPLRFWEKIEEEKGLGFWDLEGRVWKWMKNGI